MILNTSEIYNWQRMSRMNQRSGTKLKWKPSIPIMKVKKKGKKVKQNVQLKRCNTSAVDPIVNPAITKKESPGKTKFKWTIVFNTFTVK